MSWDAFLMLSEQSLVPMHKVASLQLVLVQIVPLLSQRMVW